MKRMRFDEELTAEEYAEIEAYRLAHAEKYARFNMKGLTISAEDRENAGLDWDEPTQFDFKFEIDYLNY